MRGTDSLELLRMARCPNTDCTGGGYYGPHGEAIQCQWCAERTAALSRAAGQEVVLSVEVVRDAVVEVLLEHSDMEIDAPVLCDLIIERVRGSVPPTNPAEIGSKSVGGREEAERHEFITGVGDVVILRNLCEEVDDMHPTVREQVLRIADRIERGEMVGMTRCRRCGEKSEVSIHGYTPAQPPASAEVVTFVSCTCHEPRQKELCLNKHRCVRAYPLAASSGRKGG